MRIGPQFEHRDSVPKFRSTGAQIMGAGAQIDKGWCHNLLQMFTAQLSLGPFRIALLGMKFGRNLYTLRNKFRRGPPIILAPDFGTTLWTHPLRDDLQRNWAVY